MEIINLMAKRFHKNPIVLGDDDCAAELLLRLEPDGTATIDAHEVYNPYDEPASGWVDGSWEWRERLETGQTFIVNTWEIQSALPELAALLTAIHQGTEYIDGMDPKILEMSDDAEAKITAVLCRLDWFEGPVYPVHPDDWLISGDRDAVWLFGDVPAERILDPKQEESLIEELANEALHEAKYASVVFESSLEDALQKLVRSRRHELQQLADPDEE